MADAQAHLDHLDQLIADLGRALAEKDWEAMSTLNEQVKPAVEPLMAALEAGELKGVNRNRSAAKAYQNVSSNRPK